MQRCGGLACAAERPLRWRRTGRNDDDAYVIGNKIKHVMSSDELDYTGLIIALIIE